MFRELLMFLKSGIDPNINKLAEVVKQYGISELEARVISSAFMGWVESYLNGATCPNCLTLITSDARDILTDIDDRWNYACPSCGRVIKPILVTPYRLTLTIMNKASIFDTVPDNVKFTLPDRVKEGLKSHWERVNKIMDRVRPEDLYSPILSWMRSERPDLYFTILFYNAPNDTNPVGETMSLLCTTIYEIDFYNSLPKDHFLYRSMMANAKASIRFLVNWYMLTFPESSEEEARTTLFGRVKPTLKDVREAAIQVMDFIAKKELEKLSNLDIGDSEKVINSLAISTEGIKWYATEIEEIYIKGSQMIADLISK